MNLNLQRKYFLIILLFLTTTCIPPVHDKPDDPRTFDKPEINLLDLGSSLPYFNDFIYAMHKTHLSDILVEKGPYTVFIPNQWAFSKFRTENQINHTDQVPEETMTDILLYHIIKGRWTISKIAAGYHSTLALEKTTGNPIVLFIEKDGLFRLNGIPAMDEPDLETRNGIIHSITSVIELPTILDHLSFNKEFSMILNILNSKDLQPDFLNLLSQDGPYTFWAPTNQAILSFVENNQDWQTIYDIPIETLINILKYHLVSGENMVLKVITGNKKLTSINGSILTIQADYKKWSVSDLNGRIANITENDIQCSNGVIHQIDRVLLP